MRRWATGAGILALLGCLALGCPRGGPLEPAEPRPMHEVAFDALKNGDPAKLDAIVMSPEDFVALARLEAAATGQAVDTDALKKRSVDMAKQCRAKAHRSLAKVRDQASKTGFDWAEAHLVRAALRDGPYDPKTTRRHIDIYLYITSEGNTVVVKLDDCFFVNGHRRLADGFWLSS